jgi:diguanylate cyclase (GGDEF)-like protein/PAS domain S-box-containing protein
MLPAFPFSASTRLYPEWPVAVMPSVDERTAKQLTVAMLSVEPNSEIARAAGILGFTTPANYGGVDEVLRRLRMPPYDAAPELAVADLWTVYRAWILALACALAFIVAVSLRLVLQSRNLKLNRKLLLESQRRYQGLVDWSPIGILVHRMGQVVFANPAAVRILRSESSVELIGVATQNLLLPEYVTPDAAVQAQDPNESSALHHTQLKCLDGKVIEVEMQSTPIEFAQAPAMQVSFQDITKRRSVEARLRLFASVFTHAREGIVIADAKGLLVEVNDTFTTITGYSRQEAVGQNPRKLLWSGRQSLEFYAARNKILAETGQWSGEVWNRRKNGEIYAEMTTISAVRDESGVTQSFVALIVDITPLKEHQKQLEHIAHYDALTGMPNRVLLADRMQQGMLQCQRRNTSLAVAFLDLDGFKAVNDIHGHDAGDELLIALAQRMKAALREGDTLARIGGDEFVAVMGDLETVQDCEPVLARLLQAAADPVRVGQVMLQVSASVGVTLYPQDGADADQLMRHADQAMYLAKETGKNRYHMFDVAKDAAVQTPRDGVEHLHDAT